MSVTRWVVKGAAENYNQNVEEEEEEIIKSTAKRPRPLESTKKMVKSDEEVTDEEDVEEEEDMDFEGCTSEELLYRRTKSFTCFAQLVLSSSSLLRNLNYVFPIPKDPGLDDAFNYVEPIPVYDDIGVEKYENLCKEYEIVPLLRIKNTLGTTLMNLKFYGLREKQLKAIMETLKGNHYVETLILQDNFLTEPMTEMICKMIEENGTIQILSLKQCNMGPGGASLLNDSLSTSQFLTDLNLSFNNLGDIGMRSLKQGLCDMPSLKILDLSNNKLTEDSADVIEKIIIENKTLSELNLAWNGFYTAPATKLIFKALRLTDRLRALNISWNGISVRPAVTWMGKYIRKSGVLEELDLSWNRFLEPSLNAIRRAILNNKSLVNVNIGSVPCTPERAVFVANVLVSPKKAADPIKYINMENIYFTKDILKVIENANKLGRTLKIGGILGNWIIKGPDMTELLFKRIRYILNKPKKKKARKDFGHFLLTLPQQPVTKVEFEQLMLKKKIKKLDAPLVQQLENMYLIKKNNKIDSSAMVQAYMDLWPDTCLPPPKPKKEKKSKKGKKGKGKKGKQPVDGQPAVEIQPGADGQPPAPVEDQPLETSQTPVEGQTLEASQLPLEGQPIEADQFAAEGQLTEESQIPFEDQPLEANEAPVEGQQLQISATNPMKVSFSGQPEEYEVPEEV